MATTEAPPTEAPSNAPKDRNFGKVSSLPPVRPEITLELCKDPKNAYATRYEVIAEVRLLSEFGIEDQQQLVRAGEQFSELFGRDKLNSPERRKMKTCLNYVFETVLVAEPEDKARCNDDARRQVVSFFSAAPMAMAQRKAIEDEGQEENETEDESPPTGES